MTGHSLPMCVHCWRRKKPKKFDAKAERAAFKTVFSAFIKRIPGEAWKKTQERASEFGMPELAED